MLPVSVEGKNSLANIEEVMTMPVGQLAIKAKEQAAIIIAKVQNIQNKIDEAKSLMNDARDAKTDLSHHLTFGLAGKFGFASKNETEKRVEIIMHAMVQQNSTLCEMNDLVQECVRLIMVSAAFSKMMFDEFNVILESGLKDMDGKVTKITENAKKQVAIMKQQVLIQAKQQERSNALEARVAEMDKEINRLKTAATQPHAPRKNGALAVIFSALALALAAGSVVLYLAG